MENVILSHKIALGLIPGIGDINARRLVSYLGSVEAVFSESLSALRKIPGIGENLSNYIANRSYMERAEREAEYVEKNGIRTFFYLDDDYPARLKNCDDSPVLYFTTKVMLILMHVILLVLLEPDGQHIEAGIIVPIS